MTSTTPPLSSTQISQAMSDANAIATSIAPTTLESNQFVFFAAFDGTDNGAELLSARTAQQTPENLFDLNGVIPVR
jgi:hypothetical protein